MRAARTSHKPGGWEARREQAGALPCPAQQATAARGRPRLLPGPAQVVARLDPSRLVPYDKGDPAGIVRRIDAAMGMRPKPL